METIGEKLFIIISIIAVCIFVFTFLIILSPKLRGKWMTRQIKAAKYMMNEAEDDLRELSIRGANISKEGVRITAGAVKDGFCQSNEYCKYCGIPIDEDSIYCKRCGRKQ